MLKAGSVLVFSILFLVCAAHSDTGSGGLDAVILVQKYTRSLHVMAMLLVGFSFLMMFIKRFGRSAATVTYLVVSAAIPIYFMLNSVGIFGAPSIPMDGFILAEFATASCMIAVCAVLGRLSMIQNLLLAVLFIPCYSFNEWIVTENGFGLIPAGSVSDTGGSIVLHTFGAFFGFCVMWFMTTPKEYAHTIETDAVSDKFSMLGSMVLWLFWPSFCAALVDTADIPKTAINVFMALCASTLATYFTSILIRKKISAADIANAALAGGVAIGGTCDKTGPVTAFIIGILAGVLSTFGYAYLQGKIEARIKKRDTCGVMYLHGLPGLLGGLSALFAVKGINVSAQLSAIAVTLVLALVTGVVSGLVISSLGRRTAPYDDSEEFLID